MRKTIMLFSNRSDTNRAVQEPEVTEAGYFRLRKWRNCIIHVAKTKALINYREANLRLCFRICKMTRLKCGIY